MHIKEYWNWPLLWKRPITICLAPQYPGTSMGGGGGGGGGGGRGGTRVRTSKLLNKFPPTLILPGAKSEGWYYKIIWLHVYIHSTLITGADLVFPKTANCPAYIRSAPTSPAWSTLNILSMSGLGLETPLLLVLVQRQRHKSRLVLRDIAILFMNK